MKRYIYIIFGIIVVAAVAIAIILMFKKQSLPQAVSGLFGGSLPDAATQSIATTTGNAAGTAGAGAPSSASSSTGSTLPGTTLLSHSSVLSYFVSADDSVVVVHPDGVVEAIAGGHSTNLSSLEISNILSADFSYDGKKILVSSGDPTKPQWTIFDTVAKTWTTLPVSPIVATWSPSGYQIAYFANVNGVSALETVDLGVRNAKPKFITAFPGQDFRLSWNAPNDVLLEDRSSALFSGSIFDVNLKTATIASVVINKVGLETQWNTGGTMAVILAGTQLARGGQLGIISDNGTLLHKITFLTLPSKCVFPVPPAASASTTTVTAGTAGATAAAATPNAFSSFGLICAIPRNTAALNNNPLPDAYNERMILTSDNIYGVDLTNGNTTPLFTDQSQTFDVSDVMLSNDAIYFINRYDDKLYALSIAAPAAQ